MHNLLTLTDSYKLSHWPQYPPKTQHIYSYLTSRGGPFNEVVNFGLQYILKKYLTTAITKQDIEEARDLAKAHFGDDSIFNYAGWLYILNFHDGYLPISIKSVPEGSIVTQQDPIMTIENTDPNCYWLTNYIESLLLQVWYPITVATLSRECKKVINRYLISTGDPSLIDFKLHDFGFRGVSSVESAAIGGLAHLVNFKGTDTLQAIQCAKQYYSCNMAGFSIPAAEHSTITSWTKSGEAVAYRNMIDQYSNKSVAAYAVVSDSYNIFDSCKNLWGSELKQQVLCGKNTLVIRPDSGDPLEIIPKVLQILGDRFGYQVNDKDYKVLHPKIRVIQGDGVDLESIGNILKAMMMSGWSADNIAFGMGGSLLQKLNRDTLAFAIKCSSATIDGKEIDVFKDPITDSGKRSKPGRFNDPRLVEVYRDGKLLVNQTLDKIRERVKP